MKATMLHLPEEMVEKLDEKAQRRGVPRASIIKQYLEQGLNNEFN